MRSMAELRAIAGPNSHLLSDDEIRRAYVEAQAFSHAFAAMGLDPARVAQLLIGANAVEMKRAASPAASRTH